METAVIDGTGPKVLVCILQFYFSTINWHINKADSMIKVRQFSRMSLGNIKCAIQLITEIPALSFPAETRINANEKCGRQHNSAEGIFQRLENSYQN